MDCLRKSKDGQRWKAKLERPRWTVQGEGDEMKRESGLKETMDRSGMEARLYPEGYS